MGRSTCLWIYGSDMDGESMKNVILQLVMAFDTDDNELVGTQTEDKIPIYGISQIKDKIAQEDIKTAILTVPSVKAQEVLIFWLMLELKAFSASLRSTSIFHATWWSNT